MNKCNRCDKEFDYPDDEFDEFNYPSFKVEKHVNQWTTHGNVSGWRTIELCPRCYEELKNFLYANDEHNYDGAPDWTNGGCDTGGF